MNSKVSTIVKIVLGLAIIFLTYSLYAIIQEPIRFEKIKEKRYSAVQERLEDIRDAQKAHREVYNNFASDIDQLVAFVDTGKKAIIQRKDSSFMYYNETYQQDMQKDTIITTILGYESVKISLFNKEDYDLKRLQFIPYTEQEEFQLDATKINVNDITVPVFEAVAADTVIFRDVLKTYNQYIDNNHVLKIGSLNEPTLSGNWK
jgi:hypothetical protein